MERPEYLRLSGRDYRIEIIEKYNSILQN